MVFTSQRERDWGGVGKGRCQRSGWEGGGEGEALASIEPGGLARAAQMSYGLERVPYLPPSKALTLPEWQPS